MAKRGGPCLRRDGRRRHGGPYAVSAATTALPVTRPLPALGARSLPLSATVEPQQYTLGMGVPSLSVSWLSVATFMPPCVL